MILQFQYSWEYRFMEFYRLDYKEGSEINDQSQFLNQKLFKIQIYKEKIKVILQEAMQISISQVQKQKQTSQVQNLSEVIQSKQQQLKPQTQKQYYLQTQTKRLKQYYMESQNQQKMVWRRILFNNCSGIVRCIGELKHQVVQKSSQLWVGVEWEQKGRGKHNGTVKGYKYFQCAQNQGSMVKFEKIQLGYKLQTALFRRYFRSQEMHHARNIYEELKLFKKEISQHEAQPQEQKGEKVQGKLENIRKKPKIQYDADAYFDSLKKSKKIMVQFVGFDQIWTKLNNLDKIQSISLPDCRICDLGPKGHLNDLLKSLKILSLQDNLLSHYNQIFQLGFQLPQLQELSLTNNRLAEPQIPFQDMKQIQIIGYNSSIQINKYQPAFPKLRILILINTGLKWKTLFKIIKAFNRLRQLVLCRNQLTDYQNIEAEKLNCLEELTFLNLQETQLNDFRNLSVFKDLAKLQKLTLNNNPIQQFGRDISGFQAIKSLSIQGCAVRKPVVIYEISNFKNVQNLNFRHNPLNQLMGNSYVRLRSIAEFQKLKIINGAPLKKYERKDSQIFYMRQTFREYFALKNRPDYDYDFQDFLKWCDEHHPNIQLFIKRFGNPYQVQQKKEIKEIIKNQVKQTEMKKGTGMVKVKIHFHDLDIKDEKKIPMTWTLASLKNFFAKTVKIPSGLQSVSLINIGEGSQEQMSEDHKPLSFYNITEQSTLVVKRKDQKAPISFVV